MVAREFDEVGHDQRVDAFLLSRIRDHAQAQLDVVGVGEMFLFRGGSSAGYTVVPVDAEEARWRGGVDGAAQRRERRVGIKLDGTARKVISA